MTPKPFYNMTTRKQLVIDIYPRDVYLINCWHKVRFLKEGDENWLMNDTSKLHTFYDK